MVKQNNSLYMRSQTMKVLVVVTLLITTISWFGHAKPLITVVHQRNKNSFVQVKVANETTRDLACYVAIDGYKIKFRLPALATSQWYKANDIRFDYSHFNIWCDYLAHYPEYKDYKHY